jgi:hypothetical protein
MKVLRMSQDLFATSRLRLQIETTECEWTNPSLTFLHRASSNVLVEFEMNNSQKLEEA